MLKTDSSCVDVMMPLLRALAATVSESERRIVLVVLGRPISLLNILEIILPILARIIGAPSISRKNAFASSPDTSLHT